eukprot:6488431-Amphidinium_carterae.1
MEHSPTGTCRVCHCVGWDFQGSGRLNLAQVVPVENGRNLYKSLKCPYEPAWVRGSVGTAKLFHAESCGSSGQGKSTFKKAQCVMFPRRDCRKLESLAGHPARKTNSKRTMGRHFAMQWRVQCPPFYKHR